MKFGIKEFDRLINIENKLITIGSRPGMDKTSLTVKKSSDTELTKLDFESDDLKVILESGLYAKIKK